jgi:molybdenum cofactor synthesis domain-containing protein
MEKRAIGFQSEKLLAPAEALRTFFAAATLAPLRAEQVDLDDAAGRVLAFGIDADDDYPNAPRSTMDGFALAAGATPGTFSIDGDVAMGAPWSAGLRAGAAASIPTGGVLPDGADAVLPIEDARVAGTRLHVDAAIAIGENVNARASDMRRGERVLDPGTWLSAAQVAVLATLGVVAVPVYRRPSIGVISSGDEIVPASAIPRPGEVRDSNRYAVAASLRAMGASVRHYPTVPDEPGALEAALAGALRDCDAIVLTGGSSVGERDRTPAAVAALGEPGTIVHGLRIKPGKPTLLAAAGNRPIIGLPGNPTSALIVLEAIAAPIVAALVGAPAPRATLTARLAGPARGRAGWTWYVPVALRHDGGASVAHPLPLRSSSVSLPARAGGYLVLEERDEEIPADALVTVHRFLGR